MEPNAYNSNVRCLWLRTLPSNQTLMNSHNQITLRIHHSSNPTPSTNHTSTSPTLTTYHTLFSPPIINPLRFYNHHHTLKLSPTHNHPYTANLPLIGTLSYIRSISIKKRLVHYAARTPLRFPSRRRVLRSGYGALFYSCCVGLVVGFPALWINVMTCAINAAIVVPSDTGIVLPVVHEPW